RLPDPGRRCVIDAARLEDLLAPGLRSRAGRVPDADDQLLLRVLAGLQGVGDVEAESIVTAPVRAERLAVDTHGCLPVDRTEVQPHPTAGARPAPRHLEGPAIPQAIAVLHHAREGRLDRERDEDLLAQGATDRRRLALLDERQLPQSVQVEPLVAHELRTGVFR